MHRSAAALVALGCSGSPAPSATDAATTGGTDAVASGGCGMPRDAGSIPDGLTFVPMSDGGPGSPVTIAWTINGQPGSSTSCRGTTADRLWAVNSTLIESGMRAYYNSQSGRLPALCTAGSHTYPSVVGGCYDVRASLVEIRRDTGPTGMLLDYPAATTVTLGPGPQTVTIHFTVP